MASAIEWLSGARPRTLPAAAAPVFVGTGAAAEVGGFDVSAAVLALVVALALQLGVNFANDYSDGVRGTDLDRLGPMRLTASGAAAPGHVKAAAFACFGVAALAGLVLCAISGHWWLIAVGVAAIVAAWFYTGGKHPYGYHGLGEVGVFVFFGLVAVLGTVYTQAAVITWPSVLGAIGTGLIACALLMINNIRDVPTDTASGKRTLAVRMGEARARWAYGAMLWTALALGAACAFWSPWALVTLLLAAPALVMSIMVLTVARGRLLITMLAATGMFQLAYGVLLGLGLAL